MAAMVGGAVAGLAIDAVAAPESKNGTADSKPGPESKTNEVSNKGTKMKILVHLTAGPEAPSRAALAFLIAKTAIEEGHTATMFLASDAVQLVRDGVVENLVGLGTGNLKEMMAALVAANVKIYLSGLSSKARGLTDAELKGKPFEFAPPKQLIKLAIEHDRMFTY